MNYLANQPRSYDLDKNFGSNGPFTASVKWSDKISIFFCCQKNWLAGWLVSLLKISLDMING